MKSFLAELKNASSTGPQAASDRSAKPAYVGSTPTSCSKLLEEAIKAFDYKEGKVIPQQPWLTDWLKRANDSMVKYLELKETSMKPISKDNGIRSDASKVFSVRTLGQGIGCPTNPTPDGRRVTACSYCGEVK